ncbi:metallophosphoesterase [Paenibacillus sp. GCM10027626]|uniref:metallophosphoesterase n=1 Tax=Paenibacillus sp. GCM10027626 TaxID=3273411 RepID=UPI003627CA46
MKKSSKGKRLKRALLSVLACFVLLIAFVYMQNGWLQVSRYTVTSNKLPAAFDHYKIVQLSDLHSKTFGHNNADLVNKIHEIQPDLIVMTGDMKNSTNDDGEIFLQLAEQLQAQYPIYYVSGNHEQIMSSIASREQSDEYEQYMARIADLGVHVMDESGTKIVKNGESIQLYGLTLPLRFYKAKDTASYVGEKPLDKAYIEKRIGAAEPGAFTILMTHNPLYFEQYAEWGADLTLAGHMHGGVIRIPFAGGLLSPERSFFPKYDAGKFTLEQASGPAALIINRGMGDEKVNIGLGEVKLPRVFNPPEITVIELLKQS